MFIVMATDYAKMCQVFTDQDELFLIASLAVVHLLMLCAWTCMRFYVLYCLFCLILLINVRTRLCMHVCVVY